MPVTDTPSATIDKLNRALRVELDELRSSGTLKGAEMVITKVIPANGAKGPRFLLEGYGEREFLKMNSNSYLGMSLRKEVIAAEERASAEFGAGPGAVRFISGSYQAHIDLEKKLAEFHRRPAGMIFSSAYTTIMGVLAPLTTKETTVISDELNHNCIINAMRLSRPKAKAIYKHLDMAELESCLQGAVGTCQRVLVVTDGIFSMRGDYAPLDKVAELCRKYSGEFQEGVISVVDDSHGVGAFGKTGRGTEEYTNAQGIDILVATLGKALGVNGGYVVSSDTVIDYLREKAPMYIYSNPITVSEASAAHKALEILDSPEGIGLLEKLLALTKRFEQGLLALGYEVIESEHPVVPLMVRDTERTAKLVTFLVENGVLGTGLNFPVVPRGDEEIRFQVSAEHTEFDIDFALDALKRFRYVN
jgi:glycine C-acetyltransferase